jgi:hypothetical protein
MRRVRTKSAGGGWSERISKLPSIEELEARMLCHCKAIRLAREKLIEELGNHLCGGGNGPTPKQVRALKHMTRIVEKIQCDVAKHQAYRLLRSLDPLEEDKP